MREFRNTWPGGAAQPSWWSFHHQNVATLERWKELGWVVSGRRRMRPGPRGRCGHGGSPLQDQQERAAADRARGTAAEYQWIRSWRNAVGLLEHTRYPDRGGIGVRWVLRALGEAAMKTGSRYIAFGTRSLSVATGLDHTTVAAHLRRLRDEEDPLIDLIENDRGLAGDLYQLRIPDEAAARAATLSWPAGKLHALRPVFRELGHPAAFAYEALEQAKEPVRSFDLVAGTGLSRSAVYEALETLAAWNLITGRDGRWTLNHATSLTQLAEQFGCLEGIRAQAQRHRRERVAYRRALRVVDRHDPFIDAAADPDEPYEWPPEPPPEEQSLFDLLEITANNSALRVEASFRRLLKEVTLMQGYRDIESLDEPELRTLLGELAI
jgi:hypothetical protein